MGSGNENAYIGAQQKIKTIFMPNFEGQTKRIMVFLKVTYSKECSDALVCVVIGSEKSNVIGCEDDEW